MSVPVGRQKISKLKVFVVADRIAVYTLKLLNNEKVFSKRGQRLFGESIKSLTIGFRDCINLANEIKVTNCLEAEGRHYLQTMGYTTLLSLVSEFTLAVEVLDINTDRLEYFAKLCNEELALIRAWQTADEKRYAQFVK